MMTFPFQQVVKLTTKPINDQVVVGVDLGLNNACVCSAMTSDGTVLGRMFCKMSSEKAQLNQLLKRIRKSQRKGGRKNKKLWSRVKGLNRHISAQKRLLERSWLLLLSLAPMLLSWSTSISKVKNVVVANVSS